MSKHLQNLERLCRKMEQRFGDGDEFVLQLRQEIAVMQKKKISEAAAKNLGRRQTDTAVAPPSVH